MKKLLSFAICLIFICHAFGQEKYAIPERTPEQKHQRTLGQFWAVYAAGINFVKSQGISPYEYGKYIGNLFASSWNKENGFEGFVNGTIFNWENFRTDADEPLAIKEKDDGSVMIKLSVDTWKKYFPEGNPYASFKDAMDCMQGTFEPIADYMGCSVNQEVTEESIIYSIKKK